MRHRFAQMVEVLGRAVRGEAGRGSGRALEGRQECLPHRKVGAATLILALSVALATTGCDKNGASSSGKPKIVATTTMIGDLVAQIAGDKVDLTVMMPAGTD